MNVYPVKVAVTENAFLIEQMGIQERNQDKDHCAAFTSGPSVDVLHYLSIGTQSGVAFPCPAGAFSRQMGLSNHSGCQPCPPGRYCSSSGLAAPTGICSPG